MKERAAVIAESEVLEDVALMNVAWAQCCVRFVLGGPVLVADPPDAEPFQDVGFDHDGDPNTPARNIRIGQFDFTDRNGNKFHDPGEPSEPFTDSNGNGGWDPAVNLSDQMAPTTADGISAEARSLIDALSDGDPKTIDMFIVNGFTLSPGTRGNSFNASEPKTGGRLRVPNAVILNRESVGIGPDGPRDYINAAHEAGQVLLDDSGHVEPRLGVTRTNLMIEGPDDRDAPENAKRLTKDQCAKAKRF